MGTVVFMSPANLAAQINNFYSMYDTGNGTWTYVNNLDPGHDFATSLKFMDFAFNLGTFIYSQATLFEGNQALAELKLAATAERLAKVGLPLDIASTLADMIVIGREKGFDSEDFQNLAMKFAIQLATFAAVTVLFGGGLAAGAVGYGVAAFALDVLDPKHFIINHLKQILQDPIVLDLDGDGVVLSTLNSSSVHFDFNGDGFAERTGWVSATDGILAIDRNSNGLVDNGLELFGSSTQDGFAVLETFDSNNDGVIDAQDSQFGNLRIWKDINQNGVSDAGELQALAAAGIASISLSRQAVNGTNGGHGVGYEAGFTRADGSTGVAQTIYFRTDGQNTIQDNTPNFRPAAGVLDLPGFEGSGQINSIAYKLTNDASFRSAWTALTDSAAEMSTAEFHSAFEQLLLQWAGVDGVDPTSRGPNVDARHLALLEAFFGDTYREIVDDAEGRTYPSTPQFGVVIESDFRQLEKMFELSFLSQIAGSQIARFDSEMLDALRVGNPYYFLGLLDFSERDPGIPAPSTPGNLGVVLELMLRNAPATSGVAVDYFVKGFVALDVVVDAAFAADRAAYASFVAPYLSEIADPVVRDIASHIVDGTALFGTTHAEGLNGTTGADVFIGGGGGDLVSGGAGSDIYVYAKHDGDLWIKDQGRASRTTTSWSSST
jgi:hypothetical protein